MLTRHYLVVARNTTLEEVSCKVDEQISVSEKILYRCVDGFNSRMVEYPFFTTNNIGDHSLQ